LEINWDSLADPDKAHLYKQFWTNIYFEPLIAALKSLCADDLGKGAVKDSLKKVEILSTREYSVGHGFTFEAGVLRLDDRLISDDEVRSRTDAIISIIEKVL
jgi:hypothetical protein